MAWFDREQHTESSIPPAQFSDVTAPDRRFPSWIAGGNNARRERPVAVVARQPDVVLSQAPQEVSRFPPPNEGPSSSPTSSRHPSRPPSRISMSPSELESRIAEHAAQRTTHQFLEHAKVGLVEALESIDQARREMLYGAEPRLIELAILIAKRIIAREVKLHPELVADLVREGVDGLAGRDKVRVHLGTGFTEAAAVVSEQLAVRGIEVDLRVSAAISEYGCLVETDIGRVDESIETRLDVLLEALQRESEV